MTPPLKLWRNVLIFCFLVSTYLTGYLHSDNAPIRQTATYYQEKIKWFHRTGKDTISIIVLGSSLGIHAFGEAPNLQVNCKPVKILHLTIMGLTIDGIEAFDLMKTIADFPPDYLFFESNLLVSFSDSPKKSDFLKNFNTSFIRSNPFILIRSDRQFIENTIETYLHKLPPMYFDKQKDLVQTKSRSKRQYKLSGKEKVVIDESLRKLQQNYCKIIFVNYPIIESSAYQKIQVELDRKLQKYYTDQQINLWKMPPNLMHDSLYMDGAHLNESGSHVFVPWFLGRLNEEICSN